MPAVPGCIITTIRGARVIIEEKERDVSNRSPESEESSSSSPPPDSKLEGTVLNAFGFIAVFGRY